MGSRSYSRNYIKFPLQPPRYTSRPLLSQEERTALKRGDVRLGTFNGRWLKDFTDTREFDKAGFFFSVGHNDQVQFFFCEAVVGNWEEDNAPIGEHRRHFEPCPFVEGVDVGHSLVKPSALTEEYEICGRSMGSRSYSKDYINIRLQLPGYTS